MNRTFVVIGALAVLLLGSVAGFGASNRMRVTVPFEFHAGNQILSAGEYIVEFRSLGSSGTGSIVYFKDHDQKVLHLLPAIPGTRADNSTEYLLFNRYGQDYFLAKACQASYEAAPLKTRLERELALAHSGTQHAKGVVIAAVK